MGFEPTRGDPIGLAGRRLNRSAKVSLALRGRPFLYEANVLCAFSPQQPQAGRERWLFRRLHELLFFCERAHQDSFQCCAPSNKHGTSGLVAMTSASHAEGRQFDPGLVYICVSRASVRHCAT